MWIKDREEVHGDPPGTVFVDPINPAQSKLLSNTF